LTTFQAYLNYYGVPANTNVALEFAFIVDVVYAAKKIRDFNVGDFVNTRHWTPQHVASLLGALIYNNYFLGLTLDDCLHMTDAVVARNLVLLVRHNLAIEHLALRRVGVRSEALVELTAALKARPEPMALRTLDLTGVAQFDDRVALRCGVGFATLKALRSLRVDDVGLSDAGARALLSALLVTQHTESSRARGDRRAVKSLPPGAAVLSASDAESAVSGGESAQDGLMELSMRNVPMSTPATSSVLAATLGNARALMALSLHGATFVVKDVLDALLISE
jgi:hypothetical protein